MRNSNEIMSFSPYLFWDVDVESIDMDANAPYVVKRVLELGTWADWKLLEAHYGLQRITEIAKGLRDLEPKALSFISTISSTPQSSFRCYSQKQYSRKHWIY